MKKISKLRSVTWFFPLLFSHFLYFWQPAEFLICSIRYEVRACNGTERFELLWLFQLSTNSFINVTKSHYSGNCVSTFPGHKTEVIMCVHQSCVFWCILAKLVSCFTVTIWLGCPWQGWEIVLLVLSFLCSDISRVTRSFCLETLVVEEAFRCFTYLKVAIKQWKKKIQVKFLCSKLYLRKNTHKNPPLFFCLTWVALLT